MRERARRAKWGAPVVCTAVLAAGGCGGSGSVPHSIVLISIDTLRADHLPAYGYRGGRTPAVDGLAADGILFENAYAHAPQTLPSHVSILSGRLPFEPCVRDNLVFARLPQEVLLPEVV